MNIAERNRTLVKENTRLTRQAASLRAALRSADGQSSEGEDPNGIWIRFPVDAWERIKEFAR